MGNPRYVKPEQASAPLTLSGADNSDERLRSEVFTPQDRTTMSATQLTRKLDELIDHLENASELARKGDSAAATKAYATAIRKAEDIDQVSVARERRNIKQALQDKDLNPSERRELLQQDANLHTLERAPGFALANYALVLIRMGDQTNGTELLVRAQQRDREMGEDPNFKRHLKQAIEESAQSQKAGTVRVSAELPPGFPQPTIPNPVRPTETYTPPQTVVKPLVPQQPQQFAPIQQPQQFAPQQPGYKGPSDVHPIQHVPGVTRSDAPIPVKPEGMQGARFSPLDAQKHTPIEAASALYAQVVKEKTITPAAYQQFMQTITNADAGISPRFQPFVEKQMESMKAIENFGIANPNVVAAVAAIDDSAAAFITRMQPQQKVIAAQLYLQIDRVGTQKERDNIQAQLIAMDPTFQQILQQRDQTIGPVLQQLLMNNAQVQGAIEKQFQNKENQAEFNQAAITRFTFALALEKANRPDEARAMMAQALSTNNSQDAAQNQFWKKTAERMGVIMTGEPVRQGDTPPNPAAAGRIEPKPTGTAAEHVMYNLQKFKEAIDGGANPTTVFGQLKPQFEQAIAKADAEFETVAKKIPQIEKLSAEVASVQLTPDARAKSQSFAKQIIAEKDQMTPQVLELAKKFQNVALPDAERNALRPYLTQVAPKFVALSDQFEAFAGKDFVVKLNQVLQDEHEINNAIAGRFVSRLSMAQCADKAGDANTATTKLVEGLAAVPGTYQKIYLQQKEVAQLADKVGLRQDQLPIPPDLILTRSDRTGESKAEKVTVPGISEENQGSSPEHVMRHAKQMLRMEGMTAATKKQFEDAIKVADFVFNKNDVKDAEKFVQWLKTGKQDNGTPITPAEREQYHAILDNTFARATIGIQFRSQYAQLLLENKQQASAEKMHLERIKLADELPLQLFRSELEQLSVDMRNKDLGRRAQDNLGVMFEQIGGTGSSKDDGLLYMPISARKQAVYFYMSKMEGVENGLFKPDHAIDMINETRAAELRLYGVDLTKNPKADAQLYGMAAKFEPYASEHLRQNKQRYDSYWSNGFIDAGAGVVALTGAAFLASLATRNPKYFAWALTGDKALTTTAKIGIGAIAFSGATATRSYLHREATGHDEDLSTSLIHTTAGVAGIAGIVATRGMVNRILFRGATEEGALLRVTDAYGKTVEGAVGGEKILKVEQLGEFYVKNNIRIPQATAKWMAENKELVVATGRTVNPAVFDLCKLGLNPAQSASLAKTLAPLAPLAEAGAEGAAATPFLARLGEKSFGGVKNIFMPVTKLDLATASTSQLNMRAFYGNWAQASGGLFALESVRSLDREINPDTGKKYSYAESLWNANYVSASDNTLVRGLQLGVVAMGMGAVPKNFYAQDATLMNRVKGYMYAPITASRLGATTANSTYFQQGLKAGYLGFASTVYDLRNLEKFSVGRGNAKETGYQLELNQRPIENLAPPGVKALEIPQLAPAGGAPGAAPPQHRENGDLKDEQAPAPKPNGQVDLTIGAPALAGP